MHGVAAEGDAVELFEVSVLRLDGETGEAVLAGQAAADEEETLLRVDGHGGGHAGQRVIGVMLEGAGGGVDGVLGDAVFLLGVVHEGAISLPPSGAFLDVGWSVFSSNRGWQCRQ